ncbi:hypothetical protein M407DRAFT_18276 [Tulasnella calospora MUT 4182]|uniref:Fungal-type protein kinase domain-containing protein n=1 Tax=Tulasnella calospora MUT 4182 TaxID=1051891 RepID=A0A0C3QU20_9AGAM|nr:hypothetical protein M407DRAFT_18276 [Tulasnella calospora MUT 4182]
MNVNISDPGRFQPLPRSQPSPPASSGPRTDGTDLRRSAMLAAATPRRSRSVASGHPTTGGTPVVPRTRQGSRSSELKSSLDPQIKSEIEGNVVEVKPDAFVHAFLYPSSPLAERDIVRERDLRLATACFDALKEGKSTDKELMSMLEDPDCPQYWEDAFTLLDFNVEKEENLYTPFQKLFTFINAFYRVSLAEEQEPFDVDAAWRAPVDPNPRKAGNTRSSSKLLRRDFFNTHNARLKFSPRFVGETADLGPDLVLLLHHNKDSSTKPASFHWKDVKVSMEVKIDFSSEGAKITQMARYARAMLMEQFDRKFVLTVSLSATQCRLFHWDSVGCHATEIINIHETPILFIQCIARLAIMTPAELGYDEHFSNAGRVLSHHQLTTTLTVHQSKIRKYTERTPSPEETESLPSDTPAPMLLELDTKRFLFESRGMLFHRHTRVWKGKVVLDAKEWKTGQTHVVKQNWAEDTRPCEGYFYQLTDGIPTIPSLVRMEECDRTWAYHTRIANEDVIGYLKATEKKSERQPGKDASVQQAADPFIEPSLGRGANNRDRSRTPLYEGPGESIERVLLRFVFEEEYRPLSEALSSIEVLNATVQWIQGLIALDGLGIVHRDISYSNLMLPTTDQGYDSFRWSSGELGDSKMAKIIDLGLAHLTEVQGDELAPSSLCAPSIVPGTSIGLQKSGLDGVAEIRQDGSSTPDAPTPRAHHHITGTLPFIALSLIRKLQGLPNTRFIEHALHHDVESVFWVLVYFCHDRAKTVATKLMTATLRALNNPNIDQVASVKAEIISDTDILSNISGPFEELRDFLQDYADHHQTCKRKKKTIDATKVLEMAIEHRDKLIKRWRENPASVPVYEPPCLRPTTPVDSAKRKISAPEDSSDVGEGEEESSEEEAGTPRKKTKHGISVTSQMEF